ncbi:hypothetical protein ACFQXB_02035 [Plastorhodobacter daqingensis]|uniref:Sulfotransferase family protein n=1 Tax=Plastorhodobacter daqingensis TaxID=1387281 RepID=A0ABW2UHA9_9RHOB
MTGPVNRGRVVLHVGAHKTATTHLQQSIDAHAAALAADGVLFLGPRALRRDDDLPLQRILNWPGPLGPLRAVVAPGFAAMCRTRRHVFLSEENMLGFAYGDGQIRDDMLYPDATHRLRKVLTALDLRDTEVLLAVRDPAYLLVSAYGQRLLVGDFLPFDVFAAGVDVASLRWSDLVARLLPIARIGSVTIWRYEDYPEVFPAVLRRALPEPWPGKIAPLPEASHAGLSQRAFAQLQRWHEEGGGPDHAHPALVARAMFPKSATDPGIAPLSPHVLARSARAYARDLDALRRRRAVTFLDLEPDSAGKA